MVREQPIRRVGGRRPRATNTEINGRDANEHPNRRRRVEANETEQEQGNSMECEICRVNQKNRVFIPCGHTVCHDCADRLPRDRSCFNCRVQVTNVIRFFL